MVFMNTVTLPLNKELIMITLKFTIEEIRNFIMKEDSLGDVMYNLSAESILEANEVEDEYGEDD